MTRQRIGQGWGTSPHPQILADYLNLIWPNFYISSNFISTGFIWFYPIWSNLVSYDPISSKLISFNPIWFNSIWFELVCSYLIWSDPVWSKLISFNTLWTTLNKFIQRVQRSFFLWASLKSHSLPKNWFRSLFHSYFQKLSALLIITL